MQKCEVAFSPVPRYAGLTALAICFCVAAPGQNSPTFEVASVKPSSAQADGQHRPVMRGGPGSADPGQITYTNVALITLLRIAYDAFPFQIVGPDWLSSETYDISAKVAPGTTREQFHSMLLALLTERFHLVVHREMREVPGYELVVGKRGSKLKEAAASDPNGQEQPDSRAPVGQKTDASGFPVLNGPGIAMTMRMAPNAKRPSVLLTAQSRELSGLVHMLGEELGRPVVDETGMKNKYDYKFEFVPETGGPPPSSLSADGLADSSDQSGPNVFLAVQEQLGLKLVPSKAVSLEMIIIDGGNKVPTGN